MVSIPTIVIPDDYPGVKQRSAAFNSWWEVRGQCLRGNGLASLAPDKPDTTNFFGWYVSFSETSS